MRFKTLSFIMILTLLSVGIVAAQDSMDEATLFTVRIENVSAFPSAITEAVTDAGTFAVKNGADEPGPATPGDSYTVEITANPGDVFTFATMWAQSNDLFYSTSEAGIPLYDDAGEPISGSVADQVVLYDLGTEVNEAPGVGENQAPRQAEAGLGEAENSVVLPISEVEDGYQYRNIIDVIVESTGDNTFSITIANTDDGSGDFPGVLSPGVYIVHSPDASAPLFTVGQRDYGFGLEQIAEDGPPAQIGTTLSGDLATPLSPGVFVVYDPMESAAPLFTLGEADYGQGLEAIAEDGNPAELAGNLEGQVASSGVFNAPSDFMMMMDDMMEPGPAFPGQAYEFEVEATPGQVLSFATMYVQTNDVIFAPAEGGIALFDDMGSPISGDVTSSVLIIDSGTEVNEPIGEGENQAPRQAGPNTGEDEMGVVQVVSDDEIAASTHDFIRVIVTPHSEM
jgi:hypothetical protein